LVKGLYSKEKKEETETSPRKNMKGERKEKVPHEKQNLSGWFALPNNQSARPNQ
jgi:hypothetical protein